MISDERIKEVAAKVMRDFHDPVLVTEAIRAAAFESHNAAVDSMLKKLTTAAGSVA